jgi:hypothetical protein
MRFVGCLTRLHLTTTDHNIEFSITDGEGLSLSKCDLNLYRGPIFISASIRADIQAEFDVLKHRALPKPQNGLLFEAVMSVENIITDAAVLLPSVGSKRRCPRRRSHVRFPTHGKRKECIRGDGQADREGSKLVGRALGRTSRM